MRFNIMRPILLLVAAFAANNIVTFISLSFGASKETADSIGYFAMLITAILIFMKFRRDTRRR